MLHDLRHALRSLSRNWAFTLVAVLVMGLGIGAVSYAYIGYYGIAKRPLPYRDTDAIVHIELESEQEPNGFEIGTHDFRDLAERQSSFSATFAVGVGTLNLSGDERPERFDGAYVTWNALSELGIAPVLGRTFEAGEDAAGTPRTVVLGWDLWQHRYGGDPDILGKAVRVNGEPATVIGVMPEGFAWPHRENIWTPLQQDTNKLGRDESRTVEAFGRLKPGVSLEQAADEMARLFEGIQAENPDWLPGATTVTKPYRDEWVSDITRAVLASMLAATTLVLLIACANVANLFLARSALRRRELGIRVALGASRARLAAGTLAESLIVALLGGALGFGIASIAGDATDRYLQSGEDGPPSWMTFQPSLEVFAFVVAATLLTALLAGILPAIRAGQGDVTESLKASGAGGLGVSLGRLTRSLVVVEIALSCALLIGGGLTMRSLFYMQSADLGADVEGVMSGRLGLFEAQYPTAESRRQLWRELEQRLGELPGAEAVAVASSVPGTFPGTQTYLGQTQEPGPQGQMPSAGSVVATEGYFDVFRIPLLSGRSFDGRDREDSAPVVVINQLLAEAAFGDEAPVGRTLRIGPADEQVAATVIGVVGNVFHGQFIAGDMRPTMYRPLAQDDSRFMSLVARSALPPERLAAPIRDLVASVDPDLPVYWLWPATRWRDIQQQDFQLIGVIFGSFGVLAVVLAAVGVYGVLAFSVAQRTREFGVRRALGCEERGVLALVLGQGGRQLAIAIPIGLLLAVGIGFGLRSALVGVGALDAGTYAGVVLMLIAIVVASSLVPAWRATRIHPMAALRYE